MGDSVIGALRVVLGADTAALDSGLKDSRASLASFGSGVGIAMAAAAASVAAAAYSIVGSIKSTIASADHLNSLSQAAGVSVEQLSKLNYAASLSDISSEALAGSLNKLTKAMSSAAQEGAGPAALAFNALGISVKNQDGTLKSSSAMLSEIADKFASYKDGASKTALAIAIFGDAGARLIPMLNQGSAGLKDAGDEAEKFGLVLDKKTTLAAAAFNENLKKADAITQGLITTVAARLLPTMEMLSTQWLEFSKDVDLSMKAIDLVTNAINTVIKEIKIAYVELAAFGSQVANLYDTLKQIAVSPLNGSKIWGDYAAAADRAGAEVDAVVAKIREVGTASSGALSTADWLVAAQSIKSLNREVIANGDAWKANAPVIAAAGSTALQSFLDGQSKRVAAMNAEAATVGMTADKQAYLKTIYEAQAIALAKNIPLTTEMNAQIALAGQNAAQAALNLQAAQITQMALSPAEKYAQDLLNLQLVYQNTSMTAETFAARQKQLAEGIGATWGQVGSQIMGSFEQLATAFAKNNKAMGIAAKAFGIAQAIINTQMAVTKALATYGPTPIGYAAVAAAVASGAASVATIASQGFKTGGSFTVGGSGGPDSQFVPIMASPGEQVDIWRPGEKGGSDPRAGGAAAASAKTIVLQGMVWGRDQIRDLVEALNAGDRDGVKLVFN
jgi:hypothetical protein